VSTARRLLVVCLLCLAALGCRKRQAVAPPLDADEGLAQALADMAARRHAQAQEKFTFVIFNHPGSRQASDAQYYLAESYFQARDYLQAETEFDFYLKSFPNGRFQEDAAYKLGLACFRSAPGHSRDQSRTVKARELMTRFTEDFPESEFRPRADSVLAEIEQRMARREFEAARLYYRSGEYGSALVYYQYVLDNHPQAGWTGSDRFQLAVACAETGALDRARAILEEILAGDYDKGVQQQARRRLARLN
jgi:outer membrane protein assembly factor BamD